MINLSDVGCTNPHRVQAALHRLFFHVQKSGELIPEMGGTVPLVSFNQKSLLHNALQVELVLIHRKNLIPGARTAGRRTRDTLTVTGTRDISIRQLFLLLSKAHSLHPSLPCCDIAGIEP